MDERESLISQNIKRLKIKEKKFDHFGDYLVTYATLFALLTNLCKNYIPAVSEKKNFLIVITILMETVYIIAISLKVTSHYSVKHYFEEYKKIEKIVRKEIKQEVESELKVRIADNCIKPIDKILNMLIIQRINKRVTNTLIHRDGRKSLQFFLIGLGTSLMYLGITYLVVNSTFFSPLEKIIMIVIYMGIIFPSTAFLAFKYLFQIFLFQ